MIPTPKTRDVDDMIEKVTAVVRDADADFQRGGGSSRHWVRECFIPALTAAGLEIVDTTTPAPTLRAKVAILTRARNHWKRLATAAAHPTTEDR